jgi:hypothetical protein
MWPAVHVGQEHDPVARRPVQVGLAVCRGIRAAQGLRARPERASLAGEGVRGPDRPGYVPGDEHRRGRAARARAPHEGEAPAVRGPAWRRVAGGRGPDPHHGLGRAGEDADEGVIAAIGDERESRAVRGPLGRAALPAHGDERARRSRAVQGRDPDLVVLLEGDDVAPGRDRGQVAVPEGLRFPTVERHRPDLHLDWSGRGRGVHEHAFVPAPAVIASAYVDDEAAVRGEGEARDLLAVVRRVAREAAGRELRPFRDPDVALPLLVERPGDPAAGGGGGQLVRERVALHVRDGQGGGSHHPGAGGEREDGKARSGRDGHGRPPGHARA